MATPKTYFSKHSDHVAVYARQTKEGKDLPAIEIRFNKHFSPPISDDTVQQLIDTDPLFGSEIFLSTEISQAELAKAGVSKIKYSDGASDSESSKAEAKVEGGNALPPAEAKGKGGKG